MRIAMLAMLAPVALVAQMQGQPRLAVDAQRHDFGKLAPGVEVSHRFKVTNTGTGVLDILGLEPSCGCTSTVVGKAALAPGESTELQATLRTAGLHGVLHKVIKVISNDGVEPERILTLEAEVTREVVASAEQVFFLDLGRRERRKGSIRLVSQTGQPIAVTAVDLSEAPWLGVATRPEGNDVWVDFELLARRLPAGRWTGDDTLDLHLANPQPSTVHLTAHWELRPPVSVLPERVAFTGPAGQDRVATVVLKSRENQAFRILSARTTSPTLQVQGLAEGRAIRQTCTLRLTAAAAPGTHSDQVFLTLDLPGQPELAIRVAASLR